MPKSELEFHIVPVRDPNDPFGMIVPGLVCGAVELRRNGRLLHKSFFYMQRFHIRSRACASIPWRVTAEKVQQAYMSTTRGLPPWTN